MAYEIEYNEDGDYILATFTGTLTMAAVYEYIADLLPILEKTGCKRLLSDSAHAHIQFSSIEIIQFPKLAEAHPLTAQLKRAVLAAPGTSGYEIYETLSKMQGQNLRVFTERNAALPWLLADDSQEAE